MPRAARSSRFSGASTAPPPVASTDAVGLCRDRSRRARGCGNPPRLRARKCRGCPRRCVTRSRRRCRQTAGRAASPAPCPPLSCPCPSDRPDRCCVYLLQAGTVPFGTATLMQQLTSRQRGLSPPRCSGTAPLKVTVPSTPKRTAARRRPFRNLTGAPGTPHYLTTAPSRRIFGVTKISSSSLLLILPRGLEQAAQHRHVAETRHLGDRIAALRSPDAAQHDRLAVAHEHLGRDVAGVDRGHVTPPVADGTEPAHAVLLDVQVEDACGCRA